MAKFLFGSTTLFECLIKLGFTVAPQGATRHVKFSPPKNHKIPDGERPFLMITMNVRQYDKNEVSRYISEIVRKGFDRKKVIDILSECK